MAVQKIDMVQFLQREIDKSPSAQRRMEQLTPEQREQGLAMQATGTQSWSFIYSPLFTLIGGLIIAAVLMAVFNFMLGRRGPFSARNGGCFLCVCSFDYLYDIAHGECAFQFRSEDHSISTNPMPTNPGFFMDPGQ